MYYKPIKLHTHEKKVETDIKRIIENDLHGYVIKNQASSTTGSGKPDLSACIDGKYYGIEMKRANGTVKTTKVQIINLRKIAQAKGIALWAKSNKLNKFTEKVYDSEQIDINNLTDDQILSVINHHLNRKEVKFIQYKIIRNKVKLLIYKEK